MNLTLKPRMSEKAYAQSQNGVYVFMVPLRANKQTIADAVQAQFKVTVERINIVVAKGKVVRSYRKRSRGVAGQRADQKKAYVTLKAGDKLAIFESPEDTKKPAKKANKEKA